MIKRFDLKFLLTLFLAMIFHSVSFGQNASSKFIEGEMMVLLKQSANVNDWCAKQNQKIDAKFHPALRLSQSLNLWLIAFEEDVVSTHDALAIAERDRDVSIAQLNHTNLAVRSIPNDPFFDEQWAFDNNGSNGGSGTADIDALNAWDLTTGGVTQYGDTIVVAVVDGGFMLTQEDLIENFYRNRHEIPGNNIDDDMNGYIDDVQGWNAFLNSGNHYNDNHGTHVSGTVGAKGNNGIGVTGVNWDVKVMPVSGSSTNEATVVNAYGYILDMRKRYNETNGQEGAYIVASNSSFGVDYGDPAEYPLWCAMYDSLGYAGVLSAGATANLNINIDVTGDIPTACDSEFLLSVTNTTSSDVKYGSAGFGAVTIDLAAPGTQIYSTLPSGYGRLTGTSMATPHVSGAIGLMYSAICSKTLDEYSFNPAGLALFVRANLLDEGVDELMSLNGMVATSGRLNLYKAVSSVIDSCLTVNTHVETSNCGICNGTIEANVIGGFPPYSYSWSNGETTPMLSNLCPGLYTATISDSTAETVIVDVLVSDDFGPEVSIISTNVSCFDGADGLVLLTGADIYMWEDGSNGTSRSGLSAGSYFITAIDSTSGCTTLVKVQINEPGPFLIDFNTTNPQPSSAANGTILANVSGGEAPYAFSWSNGGNSAQLISLAAGTYSLTITDANGCSASAQALLGFPLALDEAVNIRFEVFPNPTDGVLTIKGLQGQSFTYSLFDVSGRMLLHQRFVGNQAQVDLSEFNSGNYILVIESGNIRQRQLIQVVK